MIKRRYRDDLDDMALHEETPCYDSQEKLLCHDNPIE